MDTFCVGLFCFLFWAGNSLTTAAKCDSADQCPKGHCCIVAEFHGFGKGNCQKLEKEGDRCSSLKAHFGFYGDKYERYCPCKHGLVCDIEEYEKPLRAANVMNIYNRCLSRKDIKEISMERNETENATATAGVKQETTTVITLKNP